MDRERWPSIDEPFCQPVPQDDAEPTEMMELALPDQGDWE